MPSGSTRQSAARIVRYCAYMAPPIIATVLPINAFAASDDPVLMTTPAPSLPTGMDSSSRPAMARIAASGTFAVITGASLVPEAFAVVTSAAPISRPRSDGLIGEASTRTTTSSADGSGIGTLTSDISSSPLFLIIERSCSPVLLSALITILPVFGSTKFGRECSRVGGETQASSHRRTHPSAVPGQRLKPAPSAPPCPHILPGFPIPARCAAADCTWRCGPRAPASRF